MTLMADRDKGMSVIACADSMEAEWDAFVSEHAEATVFHRFGWKNVFEQVYGNECIYLAVMEEGAVVGILPLVFKRSFLFGKFFASLPYFDHAGICSEREDVRNRLLEHARTIAEKRDAEYIELRYDQQHERNLSTKQSKVAMVLDLPPDPDMLWSGLKAKVRNQVRKAEKEGLSVIDGGKELIDDFFEIYVANMRNLGSPGHDKRFFQMICDVFPEEVRIFVVAFENTKVASGFTIASKNTLTIPWASSLREFNSKCPNMLLYWSILKYACESGFSFFSFGRSTPEEGTFKFKKQWGATSNPLYWQYCLVNGHKVPDISMDNAKYRLPVKIWQNTPVIITRRLGPKIIKNLT
jgi:FemAB-related protein (PEP-CTERM system-associated)